MYFEKIGAKRGFVERDFPIARTLFLFAKQANFSNVFFLNYFLSWENSDRTQMPMGKKIYLPAIAGNFTRRVYRTDEISYAAGLIA